MGGVKANPETLRQMAASIRNTMMELEGIAKALKSSASNMGDWNDTKAAEFRGLVSKIGGLVMKPHPQLQECVQRINKMATALDKYAGVKL